MIQDLILIFTVIFLLAFPFIAGMRDYLIMPVKLEVSKEWHTLGAIMRIPAFLLLIPYYIWIPAYAFYFWTAFDGVIQAERHIVGSTALTDRIFGKYLLTIKVSGLILSFALVYIFKKM